MRRKIWIRKMSSFAEAEKFDADYYRAMSRNERLETMQFLREVCGKIRKGKYNACGKRLRRVVRVIQQA